MTVAGWVGALLLGLWVGGTVGYLLGHSLGEREAARQWRALYGELGVEHGTELAQWQALVDELEGEIAKADQTIETLNHNIGAAFDAGIVQGQLLQANRERNGL